MSDIAWETCKAGHRCCDVDGEALFHHHSVPSDGCSRCAAMGDPLVASVDDECPTCGAYMLNAALHANWHRDIARRADSYVSPPTYATAVSQSTPNGSATMRQTAPFPFVLAELVNEMAYRPDWCFSLEDIDRGQGSEGLTLDIVTKGYDSYHPDRGEHYRVHHYMPVPPAAFDRRSWQRWLFEQCLLVERHEAMEFFVVGGERPYAPHHGPGNDPYIVFEHGTDVDVRTRFTGEVLT